MNKSLLLETMEKKGVTQSDLSVTLNLTRQGLWKKINGYSEFKLSEINKICEFLKLNLKQRNAIFFSDFVGKNANKERNDLSPKY